MFEFHQRVHPVFWYFPKILINWIMRAIYHFDNESSFLCLATLCSSLRLVAFFSSEVFISLVTPVCLYIAAISCFLCSLSRWCNPIGSWFLISSSLSFVAVEEHRVTFGEVRVQAMTFDLSIQKYTTYLSIRHSELLGRGLFNILQKIGEDESISNCGDLNKVDFRARSSGRWRRQRAYLE